jgi:hypothetical protein
VGQPVLRLASEPELVRADASATAKIADGYGLFGFFVMMLLFKGILISAAGPAPNYDMQRVLSSKNPREASMMSGWVNLVLTPPRYFLITGLTMLAWSITAAPSRHGQRTWISRRCCPMRWRLRAGWACSAS